MGTSSVPLDLLFGARQFVRLLRHCSTVLTYQKIGSLAYHQTILANGRYRTNQFLNPTSIRWLTRPGVEHVDRVLGSKRYKPYNSNIQHHSSNQLPRILDHAGFHQEQRTCCRLGSDHFLSTRWWIYFFTAGTLPSVPSSAWRGHTRTRYLSINFRSRLISCARPYISNIVGRNGSGIPISDQQRADQPREDGSGRRLGRWPPRVIFSCRPRQETIHVCQRAFKTSWACLIVTLAVPPQ